jgi:tetratricopeptide (TPR) repeat protein
LALDLVGLGHGARLRGVETCNRALAERALSSSDRAATLVNRGILHMYAKELDLALATYEEALKVNPGLAEAYVNKGQTQIQRFSVVPKTQG